MVILEDESFCECYWSLFALLSCYKIGHFPLGINRAFQCRPWLTHFRRLIASKQLNVASSNKLIKSKAGEPAASVRWMCYLTRGSGSEVSASPTCPDLLTFFTHSLLQFSFLLSTQRRSEWRPTQVTSVWRVKRIRGAPKPIIGVWGQPPAAPAHADAHFYTCGPKLRDDSRDR